MGVPTAVSTYEQRLQEFYHIHTEVGTYEQRLQEFYHSHNEVPTSRKLISICGEHSRKERRELVAYCLSKKWYEEAKILTGRANPLDAKELRVMVFDRILNGQPEKKWCSSERAAKKYAVSNVPPDQRV